MSLELQEKIAHLPVPINKSQHVRALIKGKRPNVTMVQNLRQERRLALCIGTKCSLKCPYCVSNMFLPATQQCKTVLDEIGVDEYLKRVLSIAAPFVPNVSFTVSGGEATENPHFVRIMTELFKTGANISLQSNLHGIGNIEKFTAHFPREEIHKRVRSVISFHLGAYLDLGERGQEFRRKWTTDWLPRAIQTGMNILAIVVPATPKVLFDEAFPAEYERLLQMAKCDPAFSELFHFYNEKRYPESYTLEEAERLTVLQLQFNKQSPNRGGKICNSVPAKMQHLTNYIEVETIPCIAPIQNIEILMDGTIRMCQSFPQEKTNYGMLQDQNFYKLPIRYTENAIPCPAKQCLCRSFGVDFCLQLFGITLDEYYKAWYADQDKPEVAKLFE